MMRAAQALAALLLFSSAVTADDSRFDFYVLALSWSPAWCASNPSAQDSAQCAGHAGFVVHGLWPQFETGYPQDCAAGGRLSPALVDSILDIMPDAGLVAHEWRKHGTCSGLTAEDYFATTRSAFDKVAIPPLFETRNAETLSAAAIEAAFVDENPGLRTEGIAVACAWGSFREVRICLTRELDFRTCAEVDRNGCRRARLSVPESR